jgi:hypothetical protein
VPATPRTFSRAAASSVVQPKTRTGMSGGMVAMTSRLSSGTAAPGRSSRLVRAKAIVSIETKP